MASASGSAGDMMADRITKRPPSEPRDHRPRDITAVEAELRTLAGDG